MFGSNLAGIHSTGAARFAKTWLGAKARKGEGLMGDCYALPTKSASLDTLPLIEIERHALQFKTFAQANPEITFKITRVGCGLAGYTDENIAPLFIDSPPNCMLPGVWERWYRNQNLVRVIIAGGIDFSNYALLEKTMDWFCRALKGRVPEVVSGKAKGADSLGEKWAEFRELKIKGFPANWDKFGKSAGFYRHQEMAWYATHLFAFWDYKSPETKQMIDLALEHRLDVVIVHVETGKRERIPNKFNVASQLSLKI